jgi:hypothetical protein
VNSNLAHCNFFLGRAHEVPVRYSLIGLQRFQSSTKRGISGPVCACARVMGGGWIGNDIGATRDPNGSRSGQIAEETEAEPGRKASKAHRPRAAGAMRGLYPCVTPSARIFQIQTELLVNTALSICLRHSCLGEQSASPSLPEEDFGSSRNEAVCAARGPDANSTDIVACTARANVQAANPSLIFVSAEPVLYGNPYGFIVGLVLS